MFNLVDLETSYIIISPESESNSALDNRVICEKLQTILYYKDYTIITATGYSNGIYDKCFIALSEKDNDTLREDAISIIDEFSQENVIVKYKGEKSPVKILNNGTEKLLEMQIYSDNINSKVYIYHGVSFSFSDKKRYQFLTDKKQLKVGMMVEFLNNDRWIEKKIYNVEREYEDLYRLLMKYKKLRTEVND